MKAALGHPFGLTLLVVSLMLAGALRLLPGLERWSLQVLWILLLGLLAYVAAVVAVRRARPAPMAPELRTLYAIRRFMQEKLAERNASKGGRSELSRILSDAIADLDDQVIPALQQLLERRTGLAALLGRYERGELPLPEPDVLKRLRGLEARQRTAIEECVQQASNAAGTLVALLQEGDDARVAAQARTWAKDLLNLYDTLADILHGEDIELGRDA